MGGNSRRSTTLSKFISLVLRHRPGDFGLLPDRYGFVDLRSLMGLLKGRFRGVRLSDVEKVVQSCPKNRFEIKNGKIRARYGHSIDVVLDSPLCLPPDELFHGSSPAIVARILSEGLKPMGRRYVHLSKTTDEAYKVGKRKSKNPIIFVVKAKEGRKGGIKFYDMGLVVLTEAVPPEYIMLAAETQTAPD